jgi:hypothetical protein
MQEIGVLELWAWGLCFALQVGVMALLLARRSYSKFPAFTWYLAGSLVQNVAQFLIYKSWGFTTPDGRTAAWSLQAVMNVLRALAVLELCRQVFERYRGIWAFIWRTLAICVAAVALFAITFGGLSLGRRLLHADRAVGLAVAVVILGLMLFARYYNVQAVDPTKSLALGFFLYSCFVVFNDTVLERMPIKYFRAWPFLGTVAFIGSVLVWGWALRVGVPQKVAAHQMLPASVYQEFSPQVNERLSTLNDRLSNLFKPREPRA